MTRFFLALATTVGTAVASLSAHHSYAAYDFGRLVEVEGVIEGLEWVAPHTLLKVKDDDARLYIFEWRAPFGMQRAGIQQDTLKKGDRIRVAGNPHRDFDENRVLNFKSVRRLADGWRWPPYEVSPLGSKR